MRTGLLAATALLATVLVAPGAVRGGGPVDPSTLFCAEFLDLERAARGSGRDAVTAMMGYTSVGYWVLGYVNGFIAAFGGDRVVGFRDGEVGSMVVTICTERPHESLVSAATAAAVAVVMVSSSNRCPNPCLSPCPIPSRM